MLLMVLGVLAVDENVVEVNDDADVEERLEDIVDKGLEGGGGVGQSEAEDSELVVAVAGTKSGLGDVLLGNADLMVGGAEVNLGEDLRATDLVEEFVDAGKRVLVLDGSLVECTVVDAHAHGAVLLLDKEDGSAEWRLAWDDITSVEEFLELGLEDLEFTWREAVDTSEWRGGSWDELDLVVHGAAGREFLGEFGGKDVLEVGLEGLEDGCLG